MGLKLLAWLHLKLLKTPQLARVFEERGNLIGWGRGPSDVTIVGAHTKWRPGGGRHFFGHGQLSVELSQRILACLELASVPVIAFT